MHPDFFIRPSTDFCTNYAQISALTRQNPVYLTVNGKEDKMDGYWKCLQLGQVVIDFDEIWEVE